MGSSKASIEAAAVPAIEGALELLRGGDAVSGGSRRNREFAETFTSFGDGVEEDAERWSATP